MLEVTTGTVIAVDQDNRPALVSNSIGAGKTLVSAYPIENYLATVPSVFDKPESTYRLYAAFRDWASVKPAFRSDQTAVEVSALSGNRRGYVILINHSADAQHVTVSTSLPVANIRQVDPDGVKNLTLKNSSWTMQMDPYQAAVVEWQQ
jgi:hypothetical protein